MKDLTKEVYAKLMELNELIYMQTAMSANVTLEVPSPIWHALVAGLPESRSQMMLSRDMQSIHMDGNITIVRTPYDKTVRQLQGDVETAKILLEQIARTAAEALGRKLL